MRVFWEGGGVGVSGLGLGFGEGGSVYFFFCVCLWFGVLALDLVCVLRFVVWFWMLC